MTTAKPGTSTATPSGSIKARVVGKVVKRGSSSGGGGRRRSCTCPGRWREWCRRRWSWLSSSSCKLRGARVVEVWHLSRYHTPRLAWMLSAPVRGLRTVLSRPRSDEGSMGSNRTAGVALLAVGICWLAAWPAFMWWMVSMEAGGRPDRPSEAAWRLWRALEILLVEPKWLANTLAVLILGASVLGAALLAAGIATLRGNAGAPKWAAVAIMSGMLFCLLGFVIHWVLLMPAVRASENPEVVRA